MDVENATQALQAQYCQELLEWSHEQQILTFVFEAFDEPWKVSSTRSMAGTTETLGHSSGHFFPTAVEF